MQEIIICDGCRHEDRVRELFAEYTGMLCRETPDAEGCLRFQGCDEETAHPAGKYAPPGGGCIWRWRENRRRAGGRLL